MSRRRVLVLVVWLLALAVLAIACSFVGLLIVGPSGQAFALLVTLPVGWFSGGWVARRWFR